MRKLLKMFALGCGLVVIAFAVLALWAGTHEEELKQKAIAALEEGLLTNMDIAEIELSVFAHFPDVSLVCRDVMLTDTYGEGDTLLWAKEVGLELGLFKVLRGEYSFRKVRVKDGGMHLERDERGRDNYHFWRTQSSDDTTSTALAIEEVALRNIHFRMNDRYADVKVETMHLSADVEGQLQDGRFALEGSLETPHAFVEAAQKRWMPGMPFKGNLSSVIDTEASHYFFNNLDLEINGFGIGGEANFKVVEEGVECIIDSKVTNVSLEKAKQMLPEQERTLLAAYDMSGEAEGRFRLLGLSSSRTTPAWSFEGHIDDGRMLHASSEIALDRIDSDFFISGGAADPGTLQLKRFSANLEGGSFTASGSMSSFSDPSLDVQMDADLVLGDVQHFLGLDSLGMIDGEAEVTLRYAGKLPLGERSGEKLVDPEILRAAQLDGSVTLDEVLLDLVNLPRPIEELEGSFTLNGNKGSIQKAAMRIGETELELEGDLSNLLPWMLSPNEALLIDARCKSADFHMASFITEETEDAGSTDEEDYRLELPDNLRIRLTVDLERFRFREFEATNVKGQASLNKNGIYLDPLSFGTADGTFDLRCSATPSSGGYSISAHGDIRKVDIRKLFEGFEDFGQDFIVADNLRGRGYVDATFRAWMSDALEIEPKSISSDIDLKLENGELIGLQSMQHIADYMKESKLIAPFVRGDELEKELQHIRFETLENQIAIADECIRIPSMDIQSSAMDITAAGAHWFDQRIDYTVTLYLRDLLIQKDQSEFGVLEDDGLGNRFYLSMKGTTDQPEFGYDRLARKEQRKKDRQESKEAFKEALKEELGGIFKKNEEEDPAATSTEDRHEITVSWGDESKEKEPEVSTAKSTSEEDKKEGKKRWRLLLPKEDEDEKVAPPPIDDDDF